MRIKNTLALIAGITTVTLFTGCTSHSESLALPKNVNYCNQSVSSIFIDKTACKYTEDKETILVRGVSNLSSYGFRHLDYNNSTYATLQAAAESTIIKGNKYFTIISPEEISNKNGSLMNTADEFMEKCDTTIADIFTFKWGKCGLHKKNRFVGNMAIHMFKKAPSNVLVYNAQEIVDYLKTKEKYDHEGTVKTIVKLGQNKAK